MQVKNAIKGLIEVSVSELEPFQGDLKKLSDENYEKLKTEILDKGFISPFHVWRHDGNLYLCDGHQRQITLTRMIEEGHVVPKLPAVELIAETYKQAKQMVLALTSQYGEMTKEGLESFALDAGLEFEDIKISFRFPEINFDLVGDNIDIDDVSLEDDDDINESVNFRIKCKNLREMAIIQNIFEITSDSISFDKFQKKML